jgi:hypothetical protein
LEKLKGFLLNEPSTQSFLPLSHEGSKVHKAYSSTLGPKRAIQPSNRLVTKIPQRNIFCNLFRDIQSKP